jgi:hypothetical protein
MSRLEMKESLKIRASSHLPFLTIKLSRSQRILGLKVPNSGHFEELSDLYCGQICVEKRMRFVCFKSPFGPNSVRLCRRHPRESQREIESGYCLWPGLGRSLQEVAQEQKVRGLCITKRSGPRAVWPTNDIFWAPVHSEEAVGPTLCPKELSV